MRLRQLAISQSVVFFAPPEVHQSILNIRQKAPGDRIDSSDVISWLLEQTCCNIEQLQPLYISQGLDYCRRMISARKNPNASSSADQRKAYLKVLELPEKYSLEELYAPDKKTSSHKIHAPGDSTIADFVDKLDSMRENLRSTGNTLQGLAHQEVEQEREVQIEVVSFWYMHPFEGSPWWFQAERIYILLTCPAGANFRSSLKRRDKCTDSESIQETVRELKKPRHAQGLPQHPLRDEVRSFVETGRLVARSQAYQQAFVALRNTALGKRLGISDSATSSRLYVTQDFSNTVKTEWGKPLDEYSRPVHWILWSQVSEIALICSDYEADAVLPLLRAQRSVKTNLITYAAPATQDMIVFDALDFYSVPSLPESWRAPAWLVCDLGIFAGRLYFDFDEQSHILYNALSLPPPASPATGPQTPFSESEVQHELLSDEQTKVQQRRPMPFSPAPLLFMQEWLAIRRQGQDFSQTMMGELCRGRRLEAETVDKIEEVEESEGNAV